MSFPRLSLVLSGLCFVGFGGWILYQPEQLFRILDLTRPPPILQVEIAAMYGGLELGLGVFFLVAAGRGRWVRAALAAQVATFGGLGVGRVIGMALHGPATRLYLGFLAFEIAGAVLGFFAFRQAGVLMARNYGRPLP